MSVQPIALSAGAEALLFPTACAILLTRDRPEMAARAVRCFERQTYVNKRLLLLHGGDYSYSILGDVLGGDAMKVATCVLARHGASIGALRNQANRAAARANIFIHWDDDDLSCPTRIAEQVALLQWSKADVVGYRDLLFWRQAQREAWLYSASPRNIYAPETTLCYWREAWVRHPFLDTSAGEGNPQWLAGMRLETVSSLRDGTPRMVATLHGANTCSRLPANAGRPDQKQWTRAPQWDDGVRRMVEEA
jgi:hypothetical protein